MTIKTHRFNGIVHDVYIEKLDGYCFTSRSKSTKPTLVVPIEPENRKKFLEAIVHEGTHCSFPHMSEEHVTKFSGDMARLLWRLGYRMSQ